jgi:hypothetical protein
VLKDRKEKSVGQPFAVTQYNVLLYMIHMPRSISDGRPLGNSWARIVTNLTPYHTCFNRRSRVALKQREDSQDTSRALPGIINLSLQISTHYCSSQRSTLIIRHKIRNTGSWPRINDETGAPMPTNYSNISTTVSAGKTSCPGRSLTPDSLHSLQITLQAPTPIIPLSAVIDHIHF